MRSYLALLSLLVLLLPTVALSYDGPKGSIWTGTTCPGDAPPALDPQDEGLFTAALPTLLTGLFTQGIKAVGEKLKAAAQEAQIEALHVGDYFYEYRVKDGRDNPIQKPKLDLKHKCVIVATRGTKQTGTTLSLLAAGYKNSNDKEATDGLVNKLKDMDFNDKSMPGIVAVFDMKLSQLRSEARLVPRFVAIDHSVRERRRDERERSITFEFAMSIPGKALGTPVVKLDELSTKKPFVQEKGAFKLSSDWFGLPEADAKFKTSLQNLTKARGSVKTESHTAEAAGKAAIALGYPIASSGGKPICPLHQDTRAKRIEAFVKLGEEKGQASAGAPNTKRILAATHAVTFFDSCVTLRDAEKVVSETFKENQELRAFDLWVKVKEFRKRPAAKFFGDALSNDTTSAGIAGALAKELDPTARATAAKTEATAEAAAREAFESAVVAAASASVAYDASVAAYSAATTPADKDKAESAMHAAAIAMDAARRMANRAADKIGETRPYPDAGTWFGG